MSAVFQGLCGLNAEVGIGCTVELHLITCLSDRHNRCT